MNLIHAFSLLIGLGIQMFLASCYAAINSPVAGAAAVVVRTNCMEGGVEIRNCFDQIASLNDWINNQRKPTAVQPLVVDIGPGRFTDSGILLKCANAPKSISNITFRGSGKDITIINVGLAFFNERCGDMSVQDLTFDTKTSGDPGIWAIKWHGDGNSNWSNVNSFGLYGWVDSNCTPGAPRGKHYWSGSRIVGTFRGYLSLCGESWLFGSEISVQGNDPTLGHALIAGGGSEVHVYGSTIRAIAQAGIRFAPASPMGNGGGGAGLAAVLVKEGATIHIHGTGIDVIGNSLPNNVAALMATGGGMIHANESSFNLGIGQGGPVSRIINYGGYVHSPYLWEHPPSDFLLLSAHGADLAIASDQANPRFFIYSENCNGVSGHWFDPFTNSCRP